MGQLRDLREGVNILLIPAHTHPLVNSTLGFTGHSFCVKSTIETITMDDVSPSFMCTIGREVMLDPVICADGHSYERSNIERWFEINTTSPLTGVALPNKIVVSNHALRNLIREWPALCDVVEVDENTPPPGGTNMFNAPSECTITREGGGGKKKHAKPNEIDWEDYDDVMGFIEGYKADIVDLETKVTQFREERKTMKQHHDYSEFVSK